MVSHHFVSEKMYWEESSLLETIPCLQLSRIWWPAVLIKEKLLNTSSRARLQRLLQNPLVNPELQKEGQMYWGVWVQEQSPWQGIMGLHPSEADDIFLFQRLISLNIIT